MARSIETLVPDIYNLFGDDKFLHNTDLFKQFGLNLENLMLSRFNNVRDPTPRLRMSNIGRPDRQLWYDINGKHSKEVLTPATFIKFSYGDLIEEMLLLYAQLAGHTVERQQEEVEVDGIKGHIDAVIDGVVVDVKSASSFSFSKFESGDLYLPGNDPFGYVGQLNGYSHALGLDKRFLVADKTLGKLCLSEPKEPYDVPKRIAHIKQVVASPMPPPRCYEDKPDGKSGNRKLDTGCSYCPHKFACWPDLKTYYYSTGPRFFTHVAKEPRVNDFPEQALPLAKSAS